MAHKNRSDSDRLRENMKPTDSRIRRQIREEKAMPIVWTEESALELIQDGEERCELFAESYDRGDAWGSVMQHWLAVATVLNYAGETIPSSWNFIPGHTAERMNEWPDTEYFAMLEAGTITADDLRHDGNLFEEYANALKDAELDY
jgi:hypothetical protein